MRRFISRFWRDEAGATALEYGLIVALISLVLLSTLTALGGGFNGVMNTIRAALGG